MASLGKSVAGIGKQLSGVSGLVNEVFGFAALAATGSELRRAVKALDGNQPQFPSLAGGPV